MAGLCAGPGLTTVAGKLQAYGPRAGEWPGAGACSIGTRNGLRVTADGQLWVPPAAVFSHDQGSSSKPDRVVDPAGDGTFTKLSLSMRAAACQRSLAVFTIASGYAGARCATGNFWLYHRAITVKVDGVVVGFSGIQDVGAIENNSGGIVSVGSAVDGAEIVTQLTSGQLLQLEATYTLETVLLTPNAVNGINWRAPELHGVLFSYPE